MANYTFNRQKAKQSGYTDEEIDTFLKQNPEKLDIPEQAPDPETQVRNKWADWLPVAGAVGGSFIPGLGTIVGGALGAAAGAALKQPIQGKKTDVGEIVKEGAFGALGGVGGKIIGSVGGKVLGKVAGGARKLPEIVAGKAAQGAMKATPSAFGKAAESGLNINKIFTKYAPQFVGKSYDDILGKVGKGEAKGILGTLISEAEVPIQATSKVASTNVKLSGDAIIKALKAEAKLIKGELGGAARAKALNNLITAAEKKYAKGITVSKALETLRSANSKFGKSILETEGDAIATAAQKLEANTLRSMLKSTFPKIAESLDKQQELIVLREILKNARNKASVGGLKAGRIDLSRPGTIIDSLFNNPQVGTAISAKVGNLPQITAPKTLETAGRLMTLPRIGAGIGAGIAGGQPEGELDGQTQNVQYDQGIDETDNQPHAGNYITGYSPEQLFQAAMKAQVAGDKTSYSTLKGWYDIETTYQKNQGTSGAGVGTIAAKDLALAKTGLNLVDDVEQIYEEDPSVLTKQLMPGKYASRKYDTAVYDMADALLRLRTGAQANPSEIRGYMQTIAPSFGDSSEVVSYKLNKMRQDFINYMQSGGTATANTQSLPAIE